MSRWVSFFGTSSNNVFDEVEMGTRKDLLALSGGAVTVWDTLAFGAGTRYEQVRLPDGTPLTGGSIPCDGWVPEVEVYLPDGVNVVYVDNGKRRWMVVANALAVVADAQEAATEAAASAAAAEQSATEAADTLANVVPKTTEVNGHALSGDIDLTAGDVGAATAAQGALADSAVQPGDLGTAAFQPSTAFATAAQGTKADGAAQKSANLSDLANAGTARANLGLGDAATKDTGTTAGTVAAGDDSRITGALQKSTATTKGDLFVATAAGTISRLPVGTDAQVLQADSTQATGLKWATGGGGGGAPGAWTAPSYSAGVGATTDADQYALAFRLSADGGMVECSGALQVLSGEKAAGSTLATLPAALRPAETVRLVCLYYTTFYSSTIVTITAAGVLSAAVAMPSGNRLLLDGLTFRKS